MTTSALTHAIASGNFSWTSSDEFALQSEVARIAAEKCRTGKALGFGDKAKHYEKKIFLKRLGEPEEFASLVLEIARNSYINGHQFRLDGAIRMPPK